METKRSFGRILVVSTLVFCLEVALAAVIGVLYAMTRVPPHLNGVSVEVVPALVHLTWISALVGAALSLVVVLPAVALGDALGRLVGGAGSWAWVPASVGAVLAVPAAWALWSGSDRSGVTTAWAVATAVLSVAALLGRPRREGLLALVAKRGAAVVVGIALLGAFALWTDIVPRYRPPSITAAAVTGTWHDGRGGQMTFEEDGRVTASGISLFGPGDSADDVTRTCTGTGTWTFTPGLRNTWGQRVDSRIAGCSLPAWRVEGHDGSPELVRYVGDPGAADRYGLSRGR
ncbi:hypothetical protein [Streptomyces sp. NPDC048606]|uniref:hypothetical protein n=1 Tax=Streptomyces sp. NPDC048606 TaxID=3154726 RepID=UPI00341EFA24